MAARLTIDQAVAPALRFPTYPRFPSRFEFPDKEIPVYAPIGGLTVATFVTLLLVPVLYSILVLDLKIVKWTSAAPGNQSTARV